MYSDTTVSPDEQAKQIMDIFPIVPGQTVGGSGPSSEAKQSTSESSKPAQKADDSLIDFGGAEPAAPPKQQQPDEVESMLQQTGKPAEGALLDFTEDMRKDLPKDNNNNDANNDSLI